MGDSGCSFSLSKLICNEDATHVIEDNDDEDHGVLILLQDSPFLSETEDGYIEALVSRESSFESRAIGSSEAESLLRCARSDSVRWVLKVSSHCLAYIRV